MNANETLHVLLLDDDCAVTSVATDPRDAVERHFAEMDAYCQPSDDFDSEETLVTVFSIPPVLEQGHTEEFDDMESEALADAIQRLAEKHPEIVTETVGLSYNSGERKVSPIGFKPQFGKEDA